LDITVSIEANGSFLFGLVICAFQIMLYMAEILMNSPIVVSCFWCEAAFLRSRIG